VSPYAIVWLLDCSHVIIKMSNKPWVIYVLKHPRTGEVRYVGVTVKKPSYRLSEHISEAVQSVRKTYKSRWILSLVSIGLHPLIEIIESSCGDGWQDAEHRWIAKYRSQGIRLVNATDGGDGTIGLRGAQTREKRSETSKKWQAAKTSEQRSEIARKREAGMTPGQRRERSRKAAASTTLEQRREAGRKGAACITFEQHSQRSKKARAAMTPEQVHQRSQRWRATMTPEKCHAAARKRIASMTFEQLSEKSKRAAAMMTPERRSDIARKREAVKRTKRLAAQAATAPPALSD
jgi:hypothetical protein